jgi:hypothetical protein
VHVVVTHTKVAQRSCLPLSFHLSTLQMPNHIKLAVQFVVSAHQERTLPKLRRSFQSLLQIQTPSLVTSRAPLCDEVTSLCETVTTAVPCEMFNVYALFQANHWKNMYLPHLRCSVTSHFTSSPRQNISAEHFRPTAKL